MSPLTVWWVGFFRLYERMRMVTTSDVITVKKMLGVGKVTTYTVDTVSLFVKSVSGTKRYNPDVVTNSTEMAMGVIEFTAIPLTDYGSYTVKVTVESGDDLDISGVGVNVLATGFIQRVKDSSVLEI